MLLAAASASTSAVELAVRLLAVTLRPATLRAPEAFTAPTEIGPVPTVTRAPLPGDTSVAVLVRAMSPFWAVTSPSVRPPEAAMVTPPPAVRALV